MTLQIFAKNPVPGQVKTRLAGAIGDDEAAAHYVRLVERTLATAVAARAAGVVDRVELWGTPDIAAPAFTAWAARFGVELRAQTGDDLGAKMRHALHSALSDGSRALLIGTDCPALDVAYLSQAVAALDDHDAVFGPAEDGGYVLVGLARAVDAFSGIPWSSADTMAATRARLEAQHVRWHELPTLWDVDSPADLARWQASGAFGRPPQRMSPHRKGGFVVLAYPIPRAPDSPCKMIRPQLPTCACTASAGGARCPRCWSGSTSTPFDWGPRRCRSTEAAGRILAPMSCRPVDVPGFDRAAMDGYALRGAETSGASEYNPLDFPVQGQAMPGVPFAGADPGQRRDPHHDGCAGTRGARRRGAGGIRHRVGRTDRDHAARRARSARRTARRGHRRGRRGARGGPAAATAGRRADRVARHGARVGRASVRAFAFSSPATK